MNIIWNNIMLIKCCVLHNIQSQTDLTQNNAKCPWVWSISKRKKPDSIPSLVFSLPTLSNMDTDKDLDTLIKTVFKIQVYYDTFIS